MNDTDPYDEWRRLQTLYGEMEDEQLQVLASEADELTGAARDALQAEIHKRGLSMTLGTALEPEQEVASDTKDFDPKIWDLVEARRVWDKEEARSVMDALVEAGVPCFIGTKNVRNIDRFDGDYERGVQIKVPSDDRMRASAALERVPVKEDPGDSGDTEAPIEFRCPKCNSEEIVFEELEKSTEDQPDFQAVSHWHCDACDHKWTD